MKIIVSFICVVLSVVTLAQDSIKPSIEVGIRSQKYTGFYTVNGITAEYRLVKSNKKSPLSVGVNMTFSRLGSAFFSNALPVNHYDAFFAYYFRSSKKLSPTIRINAGYEHTNLGNYFEGLGYNNKAFIMGLEAGVSYKLPYNLRAIATGGYNFLVLQNTASLGSSVYPVFGQISLVYNLKK
jgi:hypothetical protein